MIPKNSDIRVEVCTACNYDCNICCRSEFSRSIETQSTVFFRETLEKVMADTDQYELITFSGFGEPLMDPEFEKKVAVAHDLGFETTLRTNGYLLTPDKFKRLDELGMQSVRVSFYGMTEASYNTIHKPPKGSFERVKKYLQDICATRRNTQLLMTLSVVEGANESDVAAWIEQWEPIADSVEVWRPHNWVDGQSFRKLTDIKRKTCGRPFNGPLQIQVDGTINMCCFDFNGKLLLGDLKTQSLEEIFQGEAFLKLRTCHQEGDFVGKGYICEVCDQLNANKEDVLIYSSNFSIEERVEMTSTTYTKLESEAPK